MSNLKVNTINDASGGSAAVLYGVASPPNSMGFRNRIINGNMVIDQRNAGASVSSGFPVDRFGIAFSTSGKFTAQQNAGAVTPPVGFTNYLGVTSSSAYSVSASDYFNVYQNIEGFNFSDMMWGTANAQTATLSFWVRSSLTGAFGGTLRNSAVNRSYPFSYTVSSANTWTAITVTIPGDTSGTWVGATNGTGVGINFGLGVGSTYSGTAGAWAGSNFLSATGATSVVGTSGATFYITGVQLEAGTVATPFERRDYGRELMMCQRYCQVIRRTQTGSISDPIGVGAWSSALDADAIYHCVVTMRATPTVTFSGTSGFQLLRSAIAWEPVTAWGTPEPTASAVRITGIVATGDTRGLVAELRNQSTNTINISAEL